MRNYCDDYYSVYIITLRAIKETLLMLNREQLKLEKKRFYGQLFKLFIESFLNFHVRLMLIKFLLLLLSCSFSGGGGIAFYARHLKILLPATQRIKNRIEMRKNLQSLLGSL